MKRSCTYALGAQLSWLFCASVVTSALLPRVAIAQEASGDDKLAQTRLDQGKAAFKRKKYDAARKALLDAYQLRPNDETALYLGLASVKAKKPGDGARYLKKYLAANQGTSSPEHDQAEAALAAATKNLGTIEVRAPFGTEIYLDAIADKVGVTPMEALLVDPGSHSLRGRAADGATLVQEVKVKKGEKITAKLGDPDANPAPQVEDKNEQPVLDKPAAEKKPSGPGLLAPPKTIAPVVVALGVTAVGLAGVLVFGLSRGNAQSAADTVEQRIRAEQGKPNVVGGGPGTCASANPDVIQYFGQACGQLKENRDAVGSNALLTNVSFGVAGVGLVAAVALYLFLPKADDRPPPPRKTNAYRSTHPFESIRIDGLAPIRYDNRGLGLGFSGHF